MEPIEVPLEENGERAQICQSKVCADRWESAAGETLRSVCRCHRGGREEGPVDWSSAAPLIQPAAPFPSRTHSDHTAPRCSSNLPNVLLPQDASREKWSHLGVPAVFYEAHSWLYISFSCIWEKCSFLAIKGVDRHLLLRTVSAPIDENGLSCNLSEHWRESATKWGFILRFPF